ncbi:hypothetical protein V7266_21910 [Neobacillus drentensis]|uniref:hypothetical protein n=1 Tax=Neobacillus drentensis TaxID=220684 RepID=UPI0030005113
MYELAQVEQAENDEVFKIENFTILIDSLVISHLDGDVVIDHNKNYGYILKNSYEILTFGMKLNKNSKLD